jgi:putative ABC transport system permease protein
VQEVLFRGEDPIGKYLKIKGVFFRIVGVFDVNRAGSQGQEPTSIIYIPLSAQQQAFNQRNYINSIGVSAQADVPASLVEEKVKELLKARHKIAPADPQGIGSWNMEKEFSNFQGLFHGINIFMWIVGIGTLIAGIVGVSNIMLIIVKERTKEIGIRKALGATPFSIISMVLQESIFLTAVAGYTGLICGVGLIELVRYLMMQLQIKSEFFKQPEVDINVAVMAVILLVLAGAVAGLIPARNAAMINPIEALRSE